jgi:hypothetical protein
VKLKLFLIFLFSFVFLVNIYFSYLSPNPFIRYQRQLLSLSAGDRYYARLQLWYLLAKSGDWLNASKLEAKLDPVDTIRFKQDNYPPELKKRLNILVVKPNKTTEDWLELARIQTKLTYLSDALNSLSHAKLLDPIRDDITLFYSQLF